MTAATFAAACSCLRLGNEHNEQLEWDWHCAWEPPAKVRSACWCSTVKADHSKSCLAMLPTEFLDVSSVHTAQQNMNHGHIFFCSGWNHVVKCSEPNQRQKLCSERKSITDDGGISIELCTALSSLEPFSPDHNVCSQLIHIAALYRFHFVAEHPLLSLSMRFTFVTFNAFYICDSPTPTWFLQSCLLIGPFLAFKNIIKS